MATFNKFNQFVEYLAEKVYNLETDTLKVALTNTAFEGMAGAFPTDIRNAVYG